MTYIHCASRSHQASRHEDSTERCQGSVGRICYGTYNALSFGARRRINANVEPAVSFAPCPVEISRFASFVVRVPHEKVPVRISACSSPSQASSSTCRKDDRYLPSRCWVIAGSVEVDPLRNICVLRLIISSFKQQHRMPSSCEIRRNRSTTRPRTHNDVLESLVVNGRCCCERFQAQQRSYGG